jgi:hypothetical protein
MRLAPLYLGLAILLLVGCARSTFDCAIGEPRSDCAPGTAGAEKRMQQEQDAKTFNAIDDARCRSFAKDSKAIWTAATRPQKREKPSRAG